MSKEITYNMINPDDDLSSKKIEEMSFRESMDCLNKIVSRLESNTLELEDSLNQYKNGVEILSHAKQLLDGAQIQVETLMGKLDQNDLSDEQQDTTLS